MLPGAAQGKTLQGTPDCTYELVLQKGPRQKLDQIIKRWLFISQWLTRAWSPSLNKPRFFGDKLGESGGPWKVTRQANQCRMQTKDSQWERCILTLYASSNGNPWWSGFVMHTCRLAPDLVAAWAPHPVRAGHRWCSSYRCKNVSHFISDYIRLAYKTWPCPTLQAMSQNCTRNRHL